MYLIISEKQKLNSIRTTIFKFTKPILRILNHSVNLDSTNVGHVTESFQMNHKNVRQTPDIQLFHNLLSSVARWTIPSIVQCKLNNGIQKKDYKKRSSN